jgi:predicted AAA+ superfamily ATPase
MDRLIAERLASRERELEIPSMTKETEAWLNTSNTSNNVNQFNDTNINANTDKNDKNDVLLEVIPKTNMKEKSFNADSIFSKLKRKTERVQSDVVQSENELTISSMRDDIMKLKNEQETIKQTCLQILELVKQKDRI